MTRKTSQQLGFCGRWPLRGLLHIVADTLRVVEPLAHSPLQTLVLGTLHQSRIRSTTPLRVGFFRARRSIVARCEADEVDGPEVSRITLEAEDRTFTRAERRTPRRMVSGRQTGDERCLQLARV